MICRSLPQEDYAAFSKAACEANFIHKGYISLKDVGVCKSFDLEAVADHPNSDEIQALHQSLKERFSEE